MVEAVAKTLKVNNQEDIQHIASTIMPILGNSVASMGNIDLMKKLSQQGADFNQVDYRGRAPIHIACISGNIEVVKYLLNQSVNLDMIDNAGQSSLYYACIHKYEKIVNILVEKGATVIKD